MVYAELAMNKIKKVFYLFLNIKRIYVSSVLMNKGKYNEVIEISKKRLERKSNDFISIRNIAYSYAYLGKLDEGFDYIKEILPNISSDRLIKKLLSFFIYPELNQHNNVILYRCSFFNNEKITKLTKEEINKLINKAEKSMNKVGAGGAAQPDGGETNQAEGSIERSKLQPWDTGKRNPDDVAGDVPVRPKREPRDERRILGDYPV
jgi:tetratricopeptide (TPR) repeat protein